MIARLGDDKSDERMFQAFDTAKSGNLYYLEFETAMKYITYPRKLTHVATMRLFKRIGREDRGDLNLDQFKLVLSAFQDELGNAVREGRGNGGRGLSVERLLLTLAWEVGALIIFLIFILTGIQAFTLPGSFAAGVNSLITGAAGVGVVQAGGKTSAHVSEDEDRQELIEGIERAMEEVTEAD